MGVHPPKYDITIYIYITMVPLLLYETITITINQ